MSSIEVADAIDEKPAAPPARPASRVGLRLAGLLLPKTRVEDEKLGPVSDELKDRASEAGSEALERGKHIAEETLESAKQAASDAASRTSDDTAPTSLRTSAPSTPGAVG